MVINYPPDLSGVEKKIEELKKEKWYQKWWGIIILGLVVSIVTGLALHFL